MGSVALLQSIFAAVTGSSSQLVIVASTLTVAILFGPLRRRIQDLIDRHFYRKKYVAARVLDASSARLRDETDLDDLSENLVSAVRETMHPEHVSLWLRTPEKENFSEKISQKHLP